ncbi:MAG: hypothetical protein KZQ66_09030 [Candidatus Thiodiazotropha sp. (ex Lucinoma aequizonata)]|nr:hypothetical protein [Candidatus Thiodiazotropha sp. (ex Lucinoma aequizonata)]MCU7887406.1 hypothetical protein [Candidatus Thiodiazotropha sp. (ex Lucinoma aequizonata)]MCU7896665.1 hypothetical protein [Candidatus Thiodiazotropha sp. (ex Lucinoma aequizonata)]MCU7897846.1 hypothetical protein [Candidatus Thiodiazotropha sp. (ex Lucinoma aequizonata)]MCU7902115.1 hypothetical protein [Candidatus Thiodiazotropha sp. (ex Lucinoma aequizonata)]
MKDFGTSQSTKIDSIFKSLLCPDRPAYVTIPYCTSTASCSCTYSIMTTAMTLRRLGCALCMPFIVSAEPTTGLHSRATTDPHPLWSQHSVTT